jgi:integrase
MRGTRLLRLQRRIRRVVQTLLGHQNINTTARYTYPDFQAKQAALDRIISLLSQDKPQDNKRKKGLKRSKKEA